MIVDTSALVAILREEQPDAEHFLEALLDAEHIAIAAPTLLETSIVIGRLGGTALLERLDHFVRESEMRVVPFGEEHLSTARDAYARFGRGSGHKANLNYGDCFSYALAAVSGEALLYKGNDFSQTDIVPAHRPLEAARE